MKGIVLLHAKITKNNILVRLINLAKNELGRLNKFIIEVMDELEI